MNNEQPVNINRLLAGQQTNIAEKSRWRRSAEKLKVMVDVTKKWLNGLPTEQPHFDPDRAIAEEAQVSRKKRRMFGRKPKPPADDPFGLDQDRQAKQSNTKTRIFQVPGVPKQSLDYPLNTVKTAKYKMLTFVPKNLYEQFHRVANFYFLLIIILQFIPAISNVSPWIAMMPLTVIVCATAVKDALEDWKRHRSDNKVNYAKVRVLHRAHCPITPHTFSHVQIEKKSGHVQRLKSYLNERLFKLKQRVFGFTAVDNDDFIPSGTEPPTLNTWRGKYWRDIKVGDLILIKEDEPIPADLIVISTSEPDGRCFVETMNLDGETNLKIRYAMPETQWIQSADDASQLQMLVEVDLPSSNLHSLTGKVVIPRYDTLQPREDSIGINLDDCLLRGCMLRNTKWVIGCAVYTGPDTKLMLNTGVTPSKRSRIERQMNPQIVLSFVLLFVICVACSIVQGSLVSSSLSKAPYWPNTSKVYSSGLFTGFLTFWSSMVLFQTLVPISLYLTVEICKTIQAYFIHQDIELISNDRKCVPRAWNISDDLGQIEYLFSDKTGTLTRNEMELRQISVNGKIYGHLPGDPQDWDRMADEMHTRLKLIYPGYIPSSSPSFVDDKLIDDLYEAHEFFKLLAICHTVLCEFNDVENGCENPVNVEYKAQSPDEAALVKTAKDLGFTFLGRTNETIRLNILGDPVEYQILEAIEFTSQRKRMSVIVKDYDGNIILYCKGADNVIMERVHSADTKTTEEHLEQFASNGLRTLCLAMRRLTPEEYTQWSHRYRQASAAVENRELLMEAEADCIEQSLTLLGATAIEDKLQEGVPECMRILRLAGIKIWVLTGDKLETAINIAYSCQLLTPKTSVLIVNGSNEQAVKEQLHMAVSKQSAKHFPFGSLPLDKPTDTFALVIEGASLRWALASEDLRKVFLKLSCACTAVICCRTSPLQKAKVVELVKVNSNQLTMAVGDGANDVSMLQMADVGVGVAGAEGMQAVMASDYAITQFRHLTRLLLVHGRWSYHRSAETTLCSFHKNIAFVVSGFWYQWQCAFTSSYLYDYMYANFFNILLAMPPILVLGCFDQDVGAEDAVKYPQLYRRGIKQSSYSLSLFLLYMANGLWQSLVCYFIPRLSYDVGIVNARGFTESRTFLGNAVGVSVIICVNLFVFLNTKAWNVIVVVSFVVTMLCLIGLLIVCSFIYGMTLFGSVAQLAEPRFYAVLLLSVSVAITPQLLYKLTQSQFAPNDVDIVREAAMVGQLKGATVESTNHSVEDMLMTGVEAVAPPPKALVRSFGDGDGDGDYEHDNGKQQLTDANRQNQSKNQSRLIRKISSVADQFKRARMSIINLGTQRTERHTGYAFSQQDHGSGLVLRSLSPVVRKRS